MGGGVRGARSLAFIQHGQDHRDATDGFAYLLSPKRQWFEEDELFLARVPVDRITERSVYEFSCAIGGTAWSRDPAAMRPVFTHSPGLVQQCEAVYLKPLDRYVMVQWKLGTRRYNPRHDHFSELFLLEAPRPWGPWSLFHEDLRWGVSEHDYRSCGRIPADLVSPDGLSFHLQYSGWTPVTGAPCTPYNYNLQKVELVF